MKKLLSTFLICASILTPAFVFSQSVFGQGGANIVGVVTDDVGNPLPGANVIIEGMKYGAASNTEGEYSFVVPSGVVKNQQVNLVARFIGYRSQKAAITLSPGTITHNFKLEVDVLKLESVVVTGVGATQMKEKLGVAIAKVAPELVENADQPNIVSALSGKVANVEITKTSGDAGTNTYIRIRGPASIDRGNQPLFVVDGVPINNQTNYIRGYNGGMEAQNRASDLNVEDIASIEILKGASAAAIYGSRASNGVIMITTKSGKAGRVKINFKSSIGSTEMTKFYPVQTWFGQGTKGAFKKDYSRSWGRPLNVPGSPFYDAGKPGDTIYDHPREVTNGGYSNENNVTISGGNDKTTFFASFGRYFEQGHWVAGSDYTRYTARVKASQAVTDKLKITGNIAYANTNAHYLERGDNAVGIMLATTRTPPEFNNLPYIDPVTGFHRSYRYSEAKELRKSRKFDNPFFIMHEHVNPADMNRVYGNMKLDYDVQDWINLSYTFGTDYSLDDRLNVDPIGDSRENGVGRIRRANFGFLEWDSNLILSLEGRKFLGKYKNIDATLMLGHNLNSRDYRRLQATGVDMGIPGWNQLDNTVSTNLTTNEYRYLIHTNAIFAQATLDLFDQLYFTGALRNEGSSTFGKSQKQHWYPKASAAWEFTKFKKIPYVSFGKLRFAYGEAGVQPGVYNTVTGYNAGTSGDGWGANLNLTYNGINGYRASTRLGNDNVKPERTKEIEIGSDLSFWNSRIGLELTYYKAKSTDVLFDINVAPSTGSFDQTANAASIENHGFELNLDLVPVKLRDFTWNLTFIYARNKNKVLDMSGANWEQVGRWAYAAPGHELGELRLATWKRFGFGMTTEENGQMVNIDKKYAGQWKKYDVYIAEDGYPVMNEDRIWSDFSPNPDWTGSIRTEFKLFKNISIAGLLDFKQGFEIMNHTKMALFSYGTHADTRYRGTVAPISGGTTTTGENYSFLKHGEKAIGPGAGKAVEWTESWYRGPLGFSGDGFLFTEDASYIKLREISVAYKIPAKYMRRFGLSGASVRLSANNIYTWTDYTGLDPETNRRQASDERDSDYFNQPQIRSFLLTFRVNY